jgi:UDP-glucose:(heptosyl)LPS alpha-1,3-glucosyltransferase
VLPTLYDAFANVCLEAMASGLPVLTTETNGAAELICDGLQGYVLKTSDAHELANRLIQIRPVSERCRMGMEAAQTASAFTLDKHLSELLRLYDRIRFKKLS